MLYSEFSILLLASFFQTSEAKKSGKREGFVKGSLYFNPLK
jgi:hypothetical protein